MQRLNLARIPSLRSSDLAGLIPEDGVYSSLEDLVLSNTGVDDDASPYIACCPSLETLDITGTKFTSESFPQDLIIFILIYIQDDGIFPIIDACPDLISIDATGCRGIPLADRRHLFEVSPLFHLMYFELNTHARLRFGRKTDSRNLEPWGLYCDAEYVLIML